MIKVWSMMGNALKSLFRTAAVAYLLAGTAGAGEAQQPAYLAIYKPTSFGDFLLDARRLATAQERVQIFGWYVKMGELELLFPNKLGPFFAEQRMSLDYSIILITGEALRATRKYMLECRNPMAPMIACPIRVLASASMCTMRVTGVERPCLIVEDSIDTPQR
jgi:hypothetical protein